jgi:hypothetical protein
MVWIYTTVDDGDTYPSPGSTLEQVETDLIRYIPILSHLDTLC